MRFKTLDEWLNWQETLHPSAIDMGLERIVTVARRLDLLNPSHAVITVGGTNGKGSCVAMLAAIYRTAGYRVGTYTSPHLLRYNERISIDGRDADDAALCEAFQRIDEARGEGSLTYFEFGTLAAFLLFEQAQPDIVLLEVGMGGRLDAVNVLDPDVALITSIAIDHTRWLGSDREAIGYEKAGILRADRPAVCGDPDPPAAVIARAEALGTRLYRLGRDFTAETNGDRSWTWRGPDAAIDALPRPALTGRFQLDNAAAVLMAVRLLRDRLPVANDYLAAGLSGAVLAGRFAVWPGPVETILDVAHNVRAAQVLAQTLRERPCRGRTLAVVGILMDKDIAGILGALADDVDAWYTGTLDNPRGSSGADLAARLADARGGVVAADSIRAAWQAARETAQPGDRIVVFGSFYTVAEILADRV